MNMKKFFLMLAAVSFLAACDNSNDSDSFEEELSHSGKVSLVASIEGLDTRMAMSSAGHGRWEEGDRIAVACSDGSFVTFDLEGTGGTVKAKFTGEIPSGLTLGSVAVWPAEVAGRVSGDEVSLKFPSEYSETSGSAAAPMVAAIGETWHIEFKQVASCVDVTVGNLPEGTAALEIGGAGKNLSGEFVQKISKIGLGGVEDSIGENPVVLTLGSLPAKASFEIPVPASDYDSLTVTTLDAEGKVIDTQTMRTGLSFGRGIRSELSYTMSAPPVVIEIPFVEVCGVKWALGNLSYDVEGGDKGFRDGWKLAPEQWSYLYYNQRKAFNAQSKPYNGTPQRTDVASFSSAYDHFNWFGIGDSYSNVAEAYAIPASGADLSGKMFSDQVCEREVTDFEQAAFGDIAFWASNGYCRTPRVAELRTLCEDASVKYGHCVVPDPSDDSGVINVWGYLFTNPVGERTVELSSDNLISEEEIKAGLFLPTSGRRANSSVTQIIHTRLQGLYWASQASSQSGFAYVLQLNMSQGVSKCIQLGEAQVLNKNYPNSSGFCIRPVVNDK